MPVRVDKAIDFQETAYHESGHCVVAFIVQDRDAFDYIDMRACEDYHAMIVVNRCHIHHGNARREIVSAFAGPVAGVKICGDRFSCGMGLVDEINDSLDGGGDLAHAIKIARAFVGNRPSKIESLIQHCAGWAIELIDDPGVWRVVSGLADELEPEMVMDAATAWKIMEESWGECSGLGFTA